MADLSLSTLNNTDSNLQDQINTKLDAATGVAYNSTRLNGQLSSYYATATALTNHVGKVGTTQHGLVVADVVVANNATKAGFMGANDKAKLDAITAGAEVNQFAFSNFDVYNKNKVDETYISLGIITANDKTSTLRINSDSIMNLSIDIANRTLNINHPLTHPATMIEEDINHRFVSDIQIENWNDKYSKNEVDNLMSSYASGLIWKPAVNTYADIATTYPDPEDGWTVNVTDTDTTYRYNLSTSSWTVVSASYTPLATPTLDGKMSAYDKGKLDTIATGAEVNQFAYSNIKVGTSDILALDKTDTLQIANGSNITVTPDIPNRKLTFAVSGLNIFRYIKSDTTSINASGISSTLTLESGTNIILTPDIATKKINISTSAEENQLAYSNIKIGETIVSSNDKTGTLELIAGNNIILTPNETNRTITIDVDDTVSDADMLDTLHADDIVGQRIDKSDLTANSWYLIGTLSAPSATQKQKIYVEVMGSVYGTGAPNDLTVMKVLFSNTNTFNFLNDSSNTRSNVIKLFAYKQADNTIRIYLNLTNAYKSTCIVKASSIGITSQTTTSIKLTAPITTQPPSTATLFDSSSTFQNVYDFAVTNHGYHVPTPQLTDNATFLRNDNSWYKITPSDIGAVSANSNSSWLQPTTNSTSTFQVKNSSGVTVFDVDTINKRIGINTATPTASLEVIGDIKSSLDITSSNNIIANKQLVSQISSGTSPLLVSSNTKVENLNSDLIDDLEADDIVGQRISNKSTDNTKYFFVGTLPISQVGVAGSIAGSHDKLMVELVGGEDNILMNMSVLFTNRDAFAYRYNKGKEISSYISVIAYRQTDTSVKVYIRILKPAVHAAAVAKAYGIDINDQTTTSLKINTTGTVTIPSGTLIFDSSNTSTYPPNAYGDGSLLDADMLDSLQSTSFMRTDANTSSSGIVTLTGGTGLAYTTVPLLIRAGGTTGNTVANCSISFHRPGLAASQIGMDTDGTIRTYNNPGTAYVNFAAAVIKSTATTGTAPLIVNSTTKVANLNAEMIDGYGSNSIILKKSQLTSTNILRDVTNYSGGSSAKGTIKITLPISWNNTMIVMEIDGYEYTSKANWKLVVSGYNSTSNTWLNAGATLVGTSSITQVRLAHDGTNCCLLLNTTSSTLQYPKIVVSKVIVAHSGFNSISETGWTTSLITDETGITSITTISNLNAGNAITLDGYNAGNVSGNIPISNGTLNVNLNADMVGGVRISNIGQLNASNSWIGPINEFTSDIQVNGKLYLKSFGNNTDTVYITKNDNVNDLSVVDMFIGDNGDNSANRTLSYPTSGGIDYFAIRSTNNNTYHLFDTGGNYAAAGNIIANANIIAKTQLASQVSTGTAPLTVVSTTKVANLNADMLDDLHADNFVLKYGYSTTNSTSMYLNQWTKVASIVLTSQSAESEALINFISTGSSGTTCGNILFKVKQVGALATPPIIELIVKDNKNITTTNIKAVTLVNNSANTTVALYIQSIAEDESISFTPMIINGTANAITFHNNQGYVASLPAGTKTDCTTLTVQEDLNVNGKVSAANGVNISSKFSVEYNLTENSLDFVYVG